MDARLELGQSLVLLGSSSQASPGQVVDEPQRPDHRDSMNRQTPWSLTADSLSGPRAPGNRRRGHDNRGGLLPSWGVACQLGIHLPCSVPVSYSVVSDSLQSRGLPHARLPRPSPSPGVYPNSCPLSR